MGFLDPYTIIKNNKSMNLNNNINFLTQDEESRLNRIKFNETLVNDDIKTRIAKNGTEFEDKTDIKVGDVIYYNYYRYANDSNYDVIQIVGETKTFWKYQIMTPVKIGFSGDVYDSTTYFKHERIQPNLIDHKTTTKISKKKKLRVLKNIFFEALTDKDYYCN